MSKYVEKLVSMIRDHEPTFPEGEWEIRRTYAGHIQRSQGAFSFFLEWKGDKANQDALVWNNRVGSQFSLTILLKHGVDSISNRYGDFHLNPRWL